MSKRSLHVESDVRFPASLFYEFGPFRLDPSERQFSRSGAQIPLTAKAFDTMLLLVQRNNHLVEKSEIMEAIWPDSFVEDSNLSVTIWMLRKALGGRDEGAQYIQTVAKRGYRFVADVKENLLEIAPEKYSFEPEKPVAELPVEALQPLAMKEEEPVLRAQPTAPPRWKMTWPVAATGFAAVLLAGAGFIFFQTRAARGGVSPIHTLAVLPFQSLNTNSGREYLGLEITDSVITKLGSLRHLQVRPTRAVLQYSDPKDDPRYIGRIEKVDAVLLGSLEDRPDRTRVNVQLIRVADGAMLWAKTFDEKPDHMFALEDDIANGIDNLGPIASSVAFKNPATRQGTQNPKAHQLYLEGRYFWNKRTENGLRRSIEYFQQATMEDDHYAEAYAGLADSYALLGSYGVEPAEVAYPNAKAADLKALELDDSLAEAHTSLGMIDFYYAWNWRQSGQEFQRSLAINPDYAMTHTWYAMSLVAQGQGQAAIGEVQRAKELDPMSLIINTEVGRVFYLTRQYDKAIEAFQKVIDLDPSFARAHTRLGMVYAAKRDFPNAIQEFEKAKALTGVDPYLDGLIGYAQASSGNTAPAKAALNSLIERSHQEYVPAFATALICTGLGDRERALDLLTRAYQDRSTYMVYSKVDPLLDPLRSDPRFAALLRRMNLI